jgi:hypothetical protein
MLTHSNLMYQVTNLSFFLRPAPGERTLSLLPPWHIYERAAGYFCFACGVTQARAPSPVGCCGAERAYSRVFVHEGTGFCLRARGFRDVCSGPVGAVRGAQVYTNIRRFKEDLTAYPPHFFICVPLVLDTLYNRVRRARRACTPAVECAHCEARARAGRQLRLPGSTPGTPGLPGVRPCCAAGALRVVAAGVAPGPRLSCFQRRPVARGWAQLLCTSAA